MKRILLSLAALFMVLAFGAAWAWNFYLPSRYAANIARAVHDKTGRDLAIAGSTQLVLTPRFGVALNGISLAGASAMAEPVITAKTLLLPLSVSSLFTGRSDSDTIYLDQAVIEVDLNGQGHANVLIEPAPGDSKSDVNAAAAKPITIKLSNGTFHFHDERDQSDFTINQISSEAQFSGDGAVSVEGTAVVKSQFLHFSMSLNSLSRAFADGSPFDLSVDGVESNLDFSGRIATNGNLNLAGQAQLSSRNVQILSSWLGMPLAGFSTLKTFNLDGAFESSGPVVFLKNANIKLGDMNAKGDVSFSNAGERPHVTLSLGLDKLNLDSYGTAVSPNQKATQGVWSESPLSFADLGSADIQFRLATNQLRHHAIDLGAAALEGTVENRVLNATIKGDALAGGTGQIDIGLDAAQKPAKLDLKIAITKAEAKALMPALTGQNWLTGPITVSGHLTGIGDSQAALLSTLAGTIDAKLENGSVVGADIVQLVSGLGENGFDGWIGAATSDVSAQTAFSVDEGIATLQLNEVRGPGFTLTSEGEVDLLRQTLNIRSTPTLNTGADITLPVKVLIAGNWAKPKISTDISDVLKDSDLAKAAGKGAKKLLKSLIGN